MNLKMTQNRVGPVSGQSRSIELDFVRGIAILLVMGYHALTIPTSFFLYRAIEFPGKRFGATGAR